MSGISITQRKLAFYSWGKVVYSIYVQDSFNMSGVIMSLSLHLDTKELYLVVKLKRDGVQ